MAEYVLPYNSKPDYDDWGSDSYWKLSDWIAWHKGLVKQYGTEKTSKGNLRADVIWLDAFSKHSFGANPVISIQNPTSYKEEFKYLRKYPYIYKFSGAERAEKEFNPLEIIDKASQATSDVVGGVGSVAEGTFSAISGISGILKVVVPIVIVLGIGTVLYIGYNKFVKA